MAQNQQSYPPPERPPKRRLTLQPWASKPEEAKSIYKPLVPDSNQGYESTTDARLRELEVHLEYKQDKLLQREAELDKWAKKLADLQREINEQEALLNARSKLATPPLKAMDAHATVGNAQLEEMTALKAELDAQQAAIEEARKTLGEREAYIEKCENDLVEKSMLLTERETRLEQSEEDLIKMSRSPFLQQGEGSEIEQSA